MLMIQRTVPSEAPNSTAMWVCATLRPETEATTAINEMDTEMRMVRS